MDQVIGSTNVSQRRRGIVIPAEFCRELHFEVGDQLLMEIVEGELRVFTPHQAIQRAQRLLSEFIAGKPSLADELIATVYDRLLTAADPLAAKPTSRTRNRRIAGTAPTPAGGRGQ